MGRCSYGENVTCQLFFKSFVSFSFLFVLIPRKISSYTYLFFVFFLTRKDFIFSFFVQMHRHSLTPGDFKFISTTQPRCEGSQGVLLSSLTRSNSIMTGGEKATEEAFGQSGESRKAWSPRGQREIGKRASNRVS